MILSKKQIILIVAAGIIVLAIPAGIFGYPRFKTWMENREFLANPELHDDFVAAQSKEAEIKTNPDRLETYVTAMMRYKALGDISKDERFYERALRIGISAMEKFGTQSYLPYLNASTIYMLLKDYQNAEKMLKKAIEMAPGDPQLYLRLIELYRDFMKKSEAEVIAVYEDSLQRLVNVLPVFSDYAAYLKSINRLEEALDKYRLLLKAVPGNPIYTQEVKDLENAVKNR